MSIAPPGPPWGQLAISWQHMLTTRGIHGPSEHVLSSDVRHANFQSRHSGMAPIIHGIMFPTIGNLFVSGDFCFMLHAQSPSIGVTISPFLFSHSFSAFRGDACVCFLNIGNDMKFHFFTPGASILNGVKLLQQFQIGMFL